MTSYASLNVTISHLAMTGIAYHLLNFLMLHIDMDYSKSIVWTKGSKIATTI
jgi:hypothetical protein